MGVFLKYFVAALPLAYAARRMIALAATLEDPHAYRLACAASTVLVHGAATLFFFSALLYLRRWPSLLAKSPVTGRLPAFSHLIFWSFHLFNYVIVRVANRRRARRGTPVASEIIDGWWLGGLFAPEALPPGAALAGIVDLTSEFDERARFAPGDYYLMRTWDGAPPDNSKFEEAGQFLAERSKRGPVLVHCAYGVGRSTTVLCAALVVAEKFPTVEAAYNFVRTKRKIARLNAGMRRCLEQWEEKRK